MINDEKFEKIIENLKTHKKLYENRIIEMNDLIQTLSKIQRVNGNLPIDHDISEIITEKRREKIFKSHKSDIKRLIKVSEAQMEVIE